MLQVKGPIFAPCIARPNDAVVNLPWLHWVCLDGPVRERYQIQARFVRHLTRSDWAPQESNDLFHALIVHKKRPQGLEWNPGANMGGSKETKPARPWSFGDLFLLRAFPANTIVESIILDDRLLSPISLMANRAIKRVFHHDLTFVMLSSGC